MKLRYLKCTYGPGVFSREYGIDFNAKGECGCWVNRSDVIALDDKNGYVKCFLTAKEKEEAIIWINDSGDHRLSPFRVKASDLVAKLSLKT